ncbi:hypothetical protein MNEG_15118 [Monoraphidium neglectum]|uniref:Serine aminopeptidase S33 domain-containing protein n=1 Tax=Monoraphidium neglectum TaxID=145388 RepID=A0A0D2LM10_9CHLO|nr:hypothetical protein MNEG_15118 [Monoraphidium neglectum]KIY92844.1 hypothetical protein MNEG_15118 [Monoraphidium neglectum]|eukprot:XP_013891864.1 hypothetical protein MNEG_15118 [Monoraphidium neglectum]
MAPASHHAHHEPCMDPSVSHAPDRCGTLALPDGSRCNLAWWLFSPAGAGGGPAAASAPPAGRVLVIWGAFATARHFDDVAAHLRDHHGFELLCYHHRGVASSGPCTMDTPQSSALLAADALALVDHVWGPQQAVHLYG